MTQAEHEGRIWSGQISGRPTGRPAGPKFDLKLQCVTHYTLTPALEKRYIHCVKTCDYHFD